MEIIAAFESLKLKTSNFKFFNLNSSFKLDTYGLFIIRLIRNFKTNMKMILMNSSTILNINLGFKINGLEFMRAYTVGAMSVAPLCILSRPFELNNVDLI